MSTTRRRSSRSLSSTATAGAESDGCCGALHKRAQTAGLERLALGVDADNPAKRLYERLGYVEYEPDDDLGRMMLKL